MFHAFFDRLYYETEIYQAFKTVCLDKLLADGYFDMSKYIYARIKKEAMLSRLLSCHSRYSKLYKNAYPTKENIADLWFREMDPDQNPEAAYPVKMSGFGAEYLPEISYI